MKKELFWESPASRKALSGYFGDVRLLADELGLMNRVSRVLWKALRDRREIFTLQGANPIGRLQLISIMLMRNSALNRDRKSNTPAPVGRSAESTRGTRW